MDVFVGLIWVLTLVGGGLGFVFVGLDYKRIRDQQHATKSHDTAARSDTVNQTAESAAYESPSEEVLERVQVAREPSVGASAEKARPTDSTEPDLKELKKDLRDVKRDLRRLQRRSEQSAREKRSEPSNADLDERLQKLKEATDVQFEAIQLALEDLRFTSGIGLRREPEKTQPDDFPSFLVPLSRFSPEKTSQGGPIVIGTSPHRDSALDKTIGYEVESFGLRYHVVRDFDVFSVKDLSRGRIIHSGRRKNE